MVAHHQFGRGKLAFVFCFFLTACTGMANGPSPLAQTPSQVKPEITSFTLTVNFHPAPSVTITPTLQPYSAFTSPPLPQTKTSTPTRLPNPPDPRFAMYSPTCGEEYGPLDTLISPGGNWLAIQCGYSQNQTLEVDSKNGKQWVLPIKDYLPGRFFGEDGSIWFSGLNPVHWTNDETYLYFTSFIGFDGGGICFYGFGAAGLFRLNLNDGTVRATLPLSPWGMGYEITFSPGGRRMAYAYHYNSGQVTILDLQNGEELSVDNGVDASGSLTWSPDGSELAYATCNWTQDSAGNYRVESSAVKIYSLAAHTSRTVLQALENFLVIMPGNTNHFYIYNDDDQANNTTELQYDWFMGQLVTVTPTP